MLYESDTFNQSDHQTDLMIEQHRAARLQLVLVDEAEDADVVLAADRGADDGVVVVDDLLQVSHRHRRAAEIVHLVPLLLRGGTGRTGGGGYLSVCPDCVSGIMLRVASTANVNLDSRHRCMREQIK